MQEIVFVQSSIGLMKYEKEKWILSSRVSPPPICPPVESGSMCATDSSSRGEWLDIKAGDWQLAGVGVGVRGEWLDIKAGDWQLAGVFNETRSLRLRPFVPAVHCQICLKGAFWVGCILWQAGQRRGGFELGYIRGKLCEAVTTQLGWMVVGTFDFRYQLFAHDDHIFLGKFKLSFGSAVAHL